MKPLFVLSLLAFSIAASAAPITFKLRPIKLTNGWMITGTVTTDGTLGPLSAASITNWNLQGGWPTSPRGAPRLAFFETWG